MKDIPPFTYRPLNLLLGEIRLVILQPRTYEPGTEHSEELDPQNQIHCSIIHSNPLVDKTRYEALSYTWGLPQPSRQILINGQSAFIRENLWSALHHLRLEDKPRILWADAICIDQANEEERNQQVSQMKDIYADAERVIVWLGEYRSSLQWIFHPRRVPVFKEQIQKTKTFEALWIQDYWRRLWIIQEFLLAKDVVFQFGEFSVTWNTFLERFQQCVDCDPDDSVSISFLHPVSTPWWPRRVDQGSSLGKLVRQRKEKFSSGSGGAKWLQERPLTELLQLYEGARCHDARDKVFGLLGLAMACCKAAIDVNYGASAIPLYHQLLEHEVSKHGLRSETSLLDLSHGLRRILQIEDSPQRAILFKPEPPLVQVDRFLRPFWCQGIILHVMEHPIGHLSESMFLDDMSSLWVKYADGIERHDLSEYIYRYSDLDQLAKKGDRTGDNLMRRLLDVFHAAKSVLREQDAYPKWAPDFSTLRIFIGENGTAGLAPSRITNGDVICETPDWTTSRILRFLGSENQYELVATASRCEISLPGDILKIPPPAKDSTLKVYFPLPKRIELADKFPERKSFLEYFGDKIDFVGSQVNREGWI